MQKTICSIWCFSHLVQGWLEDCIVECQLFIQEKNLVRISGFTSYNTLFEEDLLGIAWKILWQNGFWDSQISILVIFTNIFSPNFHFVKNITDVWTVLGVRGSIFIIIISGCTTIYQLRDHWVLCIHLMIVTTFSSPAFTTGFYTDTLYGFWEASCNAIFNEKNHLILFKILFNSAILVHPSHCALCNGGAQAERSLISM